MKKFNCLSTVTILYALFFYLISGSLAFAQVYNNKGSQNLAKIDRLDSIESFLATFSRQQSATNQGFQQLQRENLNQANLISSLKQRVDSLENKIRLLDQSSVKSTLQASKNSKDKDKNKDKSNNSPNSKDAITVEVFEKYKSETEATLKNYQDKMTDLEATIKTMQAVILQNEADKANP